MWNSREVLRQVVRSIYRDVLGISDIEDEDNFFALGGDSRRAVQITELLRERLDVTVDFVEVLNNPTVGQLHAALASRSGTDSDSGRDFPGGGPSSQTLPVQRSLYALHQLAGPAHALVEPFVLPVPARLDAGRLAASLDAVLERHEILRSNFAMDDATGDLQSTARSVSDARVFMHTSVAGQVSPSTVRAVQREALFDTFDVQREPLVRLRLLTGAEPVSYLVLSCHHLVSDAFTPAAIEAELLAFHRQCSTDGTTHPGDGVAPAPGQYTDYVQRLRQWRASSASDPSRRYWREALAGWRPGHDEFRTTATPSFATERQDRVLDQISTRALRAASTRLGVSVAVLVQTCVRAAAAAILDRWDLMLGVAVSTRDAWTADSDIGPYVNILPVRTVSAPDEPFSGLLRRTDHATRAALAHRFLPIEHMQTDLGDRLSVYDVGFSYQPVREMPGILEVIGSESPAEPLGVPLLVVAYEAHDHIRLRMRYRPSLVSAELLERMWARVLGAIAAACSTYAPVATDAPSARSSWADQTFALRLDG